MCDQRTEATLLIVGSLHGAAFSAESSHSAPVCWAQVSFLHGLFQPALRPRSRVQTPAPWGCAAGGLDAKQRCAAGLAESPHPPRRWGGVCGRYQRAARRRGLRGCPPAPCPCFCLPCVTGSLRALPKQGPACGSRTRPPDIVWEPRGAAATGRGRKASCDPSTRPQPSAEPATLSCVLWQCSPVLRHLPGDRDLVRAALPSQLT